MYNTPFEGRKILSKILQNLEDRHPVHPYDQPETARVVSQPVGEVIPAPPVIEEVVEASVFSFVDPTLFHYGNILFPSRR